MMKETEDKVVTLHPEGKTPTRIARDKYQNMRNAIMKVIDEAGDNGVGFSDLPDLVQDWLDPDIFAGASVMWYVTTVKLDLETRGLIERLPGRGRQRLIMRHK